MDFDKLNTVVLGCSADDVAAMAKFTAKFKLNFALLSDPEFKMIDAYGARRMKSFLGRNFLGIVRSSVLIGPDGTVRKVWEKAPAKGHAEEALGVMKSLS